MKIHYSKDEKNVYQTLTHTINTDVKTLFHALSTTEGIQQWFPELYFENHTLYFKMTEQTTIPMAILAYEENAQIQFEWATGNVRFTLTPIDANQTTVELYETLPYDFENIAMDFAGWQFQILNLTKRLETGEGLNRQQFDFAHHASKVTQTLNLH